MFEFLDKDETAIKMESVLMKVLMLFTLEGCIKLTWNFNNGTACELTSAEIK